MTKLKTYSVTGDIAAGVVAIDSLHSSIAGTAYVTGFEGLTLKGDVITVLGAALADETSLDALVLVHDGIPLESNNITKGDSVTTTERDAIKGELEGIIIFNKTTMIFEGNDGGAWVPLSTAR